MKGAGNTRAAAIVMVLLVLLWGYAWVLAKMALAYCGPVHLATIRTAIGTAALVPVLLWLRRPLAPQHVGAALGVGLVQTALFLLFNNWSLSLGDPGKTSVLVFTMPFWVLVLAWPLLGERIAPAGWIAVGLATVGLVLVLELWTRKSALLPMLLAIAAGVCWALGVVISKRLKNRHPVDVFNFTFWQMALGLIPMIAVAALVPERPTDWTPEFITLALLLGVLATAGGWGAWFYVLQRLPAGTTSMSSLGIPVVALIASAIQMGERHSAPEWAGMALITAALALVSWDTIRSRREVPPMMGQE
jgi:drug/metabolite transporter (DMT)-like permease